MKSYYQLLSAHLQTYGNEKIAAAQSKYMRDQFEYFGIMQKPLAEALSAFYAQHGTPDKDKALNFMLQCATYPQREMWYAGLGQLRKHSKHIPDNKLNDLKKIIVKGAWWDITDSMAAGVVGDYLKKYPHHLDTMDAWIADENFWIRRTAIIYQLKYKDKTDFTRLTRYMEQCAHEKEFFIRKAIGWALREYSKYNPKAVSHWIEKNDTLLSGLSKREGMKWILAHNKF